MNIAEVKAELNNCWKLEKRLANDFLTIQQLRSAASKATSSYSPVGGGGGDGQKVENYVLRIVELEERRKREAQEFLDAKDRINYYVSLLPETRLRLIIKKRYLDYKKWEEIAVDVNCSYRRVHQLHSKALCYLAKKAHNILSISQKKHLISLLTSDIIIIARGI